MLVIISDLHLGDGTTAESIPASAFYLFAKRLRQDAHFASTRNGKYHPIEELDVLLMGDILDPLHSTKWMFPASGEEKSISVGGENLVRISEPGEKGYVRPWSDPKDPKFAQKLLEVTRSILEYNKEAMNVLRKLAAGEYIDFDPIDASGERAYQSPQKTRLRVRFHYMVGNHDWYYHLEGEAFDHIRQEIIAAMSLCNPPSPFPFDLRKLDSLSTWRADEYPDIERLFREYKVFARHGDCYDTFTEVINNMRHITNIRPALATPLWVTGQLRKLTMENKLKQALEAKLKGIWDDLADNFLHLDFVREADKAFEFDMVDKMSLAIKISKVVSMDTIDNLVFRMQHKNSAGNDRSFANFALKEPAFLDNTARYIVYGHTHHHETIPLDYDDIGGNQIYFNSGTWHTYFDLARKDPKEKKFVPYKALTYITFYKDNEHDERHFETWSGAYA